MILIGFRGGLCVGNRVFARRIGHVQQTFEFGFVSGGHWLLLIWQKVENKRFFNFNQGQKMAQKTNKKLKSGATKYEIMIT